jgi:hypothetical protein
MLGQWLTHRRLAPPCRWLGLSGGGLSGRPVLRIVPGGAFLQLLEQQLQLSDLLVELLGGPAEPGAAQLRELCLEGSIWAL